MVPAGPAALSAVGPVAPQIAAAESVPDVTAENAPQHAAESAPDVAEENAPQPAAESVPNVAEDNTPQSAAEIVPDATSETVAQSAAESGLGVSSKSAPSTPHSTAESVPHDIVSTAPTQLDYLEKYVLDSEPGESRTRSAARPLRSSDTLNTPDYYRG